ncbi:methyltransferase [Phenylobacterium sp.]|jgi:predicted methyltransferase|uniref:class I SAM-dependent methyltransferase n=1 Tax=Phenylobacterium sp. TaxID=1871053 RepID=UPI002F42B016
MKSKLLLAAALAAGATALAAYAAPAAYITAAVADKARPANDTQRDADRKPAEMLEFAGVKPGMTVVDLIPGGGYFTRIFSKAVGSKGTVYAVGNPPRASQDPSKPPPPQPQDTIAADPNYSNVKSIHIPLLQGVSIPTQADIVWTAQNYHDLKNAPNIDMVAFDKSVFNSLKPGGVFIVLDHVANPDTPNVTSTLHRIDPAVVRKEAEAAGFKFDGESKALHNPADDHTTRSTADGPLRHKTDQFVYKFRKPK